MDVHPHQMVTVTGSESVEAKPSTSPEAALLGVNCDDGGPGSVEFIEKS